MSTKTVVVVGGGISGLAAAHRLWEMSRRQGEEWTILLLDRASRPGGVIETGSRDGFLWEGGPDSFITEKPAALELARRVGLAESVRGTNPLCQRSFVGWKGKLVPTPDGFYLLAPSKMGPLFRTRLLSWRGKLRAGMELFLPPGGSAGDESLASFVERRFGREVLERLAQPMVAGIYSADPRTLSLKATFPKFLDMEARGGVIRSLLAARKKSSAAAPSRGTSGPRYGLFAAFNNGAGELVDALLRRLPEGTFRPGQSAAEVYKAGRWKVRLEDGGSVEADAVVLAVPAPAAGRLLSALDPALAGLLSEVPYGDVATVNVAVSRRQVAHPLDGFGFVVPAVEQRTVTGCTFCSVKFPGRAPQGTALLRAFVGGAALEFPDDALVRAVLGDLRDYVGLTGDPLWTVVRRYPRSMPHYTVGHTERIQTVFRKVETWDGLALAGNGYFGIGLPDCIASGESAAERVGKMLK